MIPNTITIRNKHTTYNAILTTNIYINNTNTDVLYILYIEQRMYIILFIYLFLNINSYSLSKH